MINFFKDKDKDKTEIKDDFYIKITSLLIHAAKIDEAYTDEEKEIIKKTLMKLNAKTSNLDKIIAKATINEENSNQILDFTREIKNAPEKEKIQIIEALWEIIYSNKNADIYESNLMRRLAGLLYVDNKIMADIKEKIKNKLK